ISRSAAVRYIGQSFEIHVPWSRQFQHEFHNAHELRYGYSDSARPTEIVSVRIKATGITEKPALRRFRSSRLASRFRPSRYATVIMPSPASPPATGRGSSAKPMLPAKTPVYDRDRLRPDFSIAGP